MSHIVTIKTQVRDPAALAAACRRLGLAQPTEGTAQLYSGPATGWLVQLPGWRYPIVANAQTGELKMDNYNGSWGAQSELDRLLQGYAAEKQKIWSIYLTMFNLPEQPVPKDTDWTGAEIRSCCRLAALLDVPLIEAAKCVVPVAVTAAESVQRLRAWATGRCLDAAQGGIFGASTAPVIKPARRVSRGASNN